MHQRQRHGAVTVDEIHLGGRVFRDRLQGIQRHQLDVVGILADGGVDALDLVGLGIGDGASCLGLLIRCQALRLGLGDQLLRLGAEALQLRLLLLHFLLAFLLLLYRLGNEGG